MRQRIYLVVAVLTTIGLLGWLLLGQYQQNGQLQQQLSQTEQALLDTSSAMQAMNARYQAADQQVVAARRERDQIAEQTKGEIDALRSAMATDLCAAADLSDVVINRLLSITSTDEYSSAADPGGTD